jgi:hypothetical protein
MKKTYQAFAFVLTAVLCIAFLATATGCATVATHYEIKGAYEREARQNVMRGGRALCAIDGEQKPIAAITLMDLILENWPDYGKALGLDVLAAVVAWYIYDSKDDAGTLAGDTTINNNCPDPTAHDDAGANDTGGATE